MGKRTLSAVALGVLAFASTMPAFAQDEEEIIVTGTRAAGTSPTQSLSPVDVLG
jgi:hypothetical protein